EFITPSVSSFHVDDRTLRIDVEVENPEKAPRYCGVTLTGLQVKESPEWLKNRLKAIGLAPKNNIVDITNYVMHELGQPLHAFDANKITGNKIIVKTVEKDTPFITLDGVEHKLHEEDLMICDDQKPLCIAGVYGGENSGVTEGTTSIFLESAYFDPVSVRKTAKRHGFNTDASFRFERGIDPNITEYALKRAVTLIEECAGGHVSSDIVDHYPVKLEDHEVYVTFEQINNLIGQEIPREEITTILSSLEINVNHATDAGIGLTVPAYRNDVTRPADVIEEILRVYGYDRIEVGTKLNATIATTSRKENNRIQNIAAQQLVGLGFYEMMANSLTAEKYHHLGEQISADNEVRMLNPLSSDLAVMRQSLIYGGLEAIAYNINRRQEDLKLFEFGKSYHQYSSGQFTEQQHLTLFTTGNVHSNSWIGGDQPADFFYLKGAVTAVLNRLGITTLNEKATKLEFLGEGISLNSGAKIADLGVISKKFTREFGIDQTVHYANIYWDEVIKLVQTENKPITSIPKFPVVQRDFALLVNDEVSFKELQTVALNAERKLLKEVKLFDVYQGKNLPAGKKSYALSFSLLDENKTLTDKQIDKVMNKIQQSLEKQTGAVLR
ncbi:phenylalanine--tRNA ligase subunit beta, partial [Nonlabens tegetincola]|uniref:phenylalanine--tRNA ligase subunit beta n=1 Tax=Nonlabens tegetincola TaxID=323273 RepID=UPI0030C85252